MSRYYTFSQYFKNKGIEHRVHKITVDAGCSCPNRDGSLSETGCIYCDNAGFNPQVRRESASIERQVEQGRIFLKQRFHAQEFIVYFQSYTNTYAPLEKLKEMYDVIKQFPDIYGLAIATRPDCVTNETLALINQYAYDHEVWMEYGLQSVHEATLRLINRGHTYQDFLDTVALTRQYPKLKICAHVIVGLPGEDERMILATAQDVGALCLDGIKIHPLHVVKGTPLEALYDQGVYQPLTLSEYIYYAVRFLEYMCPDTVIQRISADCPADLLVAPRWIQDKQAVITAIQEHLVQDQTCQGKLYQKSL